jgi:hypothetical protein
MSTATKKEQHVMGGLVVQFYDIDLTGGDTSIEILTGLTNVVAATYTKETSEGKGLVHCNFSDAGSTAKAGSVFLSSCTAADNGKIVVFGR